MRSNIDLPFSFRQTKDWVISHFASQMSGQKEVSASRVGDASKEVIEEADVVAPPQSNLEGASVTLSSLVRKEIARMDEGKSFVVVVYEGDSSRIKQSRSPSSNRLDDNGGSSLSNRWDESMMYGGREIVS